MKPKHKTHPKDEGIKPQEKEPHWSECIECGRQVRANEVLCIDCINEERMRDD
jgi:hypothetical protein